MYYNVNDVLPFVENYTFPEFFTSDDECDLFAAIEDEYPCTWKDGASKLVIIPYKLDYVIKIPFNAQYCYADNDYKDMSQNYCETEISLYERIVEENSLFAQFFLPLTRVDEYKEYDIYIQPKCKPYLDTRKDERVRTYSKESYKKVGDIRYTSQLPRDWLAAVNEILNDVQLVEDFLKILEKYDMDDDLHRGNIGYCNGKPVILDYGSFYD